MDIQAADRLFGYPQYAIKQTNEGASYRKIKINEAEIAKLRSRHKHFSGRKNDENGEKRDNGEGDEFNTRFNYRSLPEKGNVSKVVLVSLYPWAES